MGRIVREAIEIRASS